MKFNIDVVYVILVIHQGIVIDVILDIDRALIMYGVFNIYKIYELYKI